MTGCEGGSAPRMPTARPVASVVVPAHDEASVIERCLEALLLDAGQGEFEIVVVANGCQDDTAAVARSAAVRLGHAVRVLELAKASKSEALRAADEVTGAFPRVYVDADVVCSTTTLRLLVAGLQQPGVELAVPQRDIDLTGATLGARLYYRTWCASPRVQHMLAGRGCYALSRAGRQRLGDFPERVADDRFVTTGVPRAAARIVAGQVRIFPPGDLASLVAVRTRVYAGNLQLGVEGEPVPSTARPVLRRLKRPGAWPGAAVYAGVTALAKTRARAAVRRGDVQWGRDHARGSVQARARVGSRDSGSAGQGQTTQGVGVKRKEGNKRVLIIVQNLPVAVDRRVWLECQALVHAGYGVTVICPKGPGEPRYREQDGVVIRSYKPAPAAAGPLGYAYEFLYCWARTAALSVLVLVREGFDAMQACNPPDTFWALALPYKLLGKTFVYDQHDLCPEVFRARFACEGGKLLQALLFLERCTYRTADRVMSTNDSYRSIAVRRGQVEPSRVSVVRSGPDPELMKRGQARPELRRGRKHLCCYLGVMGPQDGVDTLLRSIDVFVNEQGRTDTSFALLGFGDCVPALKRQAAELGLEDYVHFTGRADSRMIDDYLSTADIGLSSDPLNALNDVSTMNKTLEYMAYSLPVVAYELVETRVSAGPAGVYVRPGDERGYARCLSDLLDDPPRRARLGAEGRARIENSLSWKYSEKVYVGVYDDLLHSVREAGRTQADQVLRPDAPAGAVVPAQTGAVPAQSFEPHQPLPSRGAEVRHVPVRASGEWTP